MLGIYNEDPFSKQAAKTFFQWKLIHKEYQIISKPWKIISVIAKIYPIQQLSANNMFDNPLPTLVQLLLI